MVASFGQLDHALPRAHRQTMNRRCAALALLIWFAASPSLAWERDGFKSGMSLGEVRAILPFGYQVMPFQQSGKFLSAFVAKPNTTDVFATIAFCSGELTTLYRSIDIDTDYITEVNDAIKRYGQPSLKIERELVGGTGYVPSMLMTWSIIDLPRQKLIISFSPEVRNGSGKLLFNRSASLHFDANPDLVCK